ncbi:hypothetical protein C9374_000805 [Naegleria lovaniensis]|uniref:Uncharacterized protein n=1 Tax=Naegleria lovaniensis TaxID=51637 RepID=A0AA88KLI9_NAELO|nr:uncharacterized protein C9374_000805 [Naegleria lovaniensis]KAG2387955.1 hypothetical protein C9374_000805 [Naegleria lovaniensis]
MMVFSPTTTTAVGMINVPSSSIHTGGMHMAHFQPPPRSMNHQYNNYHQPQYRESTHPELPLPSRNVKISTAASKQNDHTSTLRGSVESIKRIATRGQQREVRFMESQEDPSSRLRHSVGKYKSTDSLVIDLSLIGEDSESTASSPSTEHQVDSTFSPSTNAPTSGTHFTTGLKSMASSEFSSFNTNFHDYSAGSEHSSLMDFTFDLETDAEERLKGLINQLDAKLYGLKHEPTRQHSPLKSTKRKSKRFQENVKTEKKTLEKIASQWSSTFPHLAVTAVSFGEIKDQDSLHTSVDVSRSFEYDEVNGESQKFIPISPFGGVVEETIAEDGEYEELIVMDQGNKRSVPTPLDADSFLNRSTPNFTAHQRKPKESPQSPLSTQFSERIRVQLNRGFPPLEPHSALFYEAQWEVFDNIWKRVVPKIVECFKMHLNESSPKKKTLETKDNSPSNTVDVIYINDNYSTKFIEELENIEDDDSFDRSMTPFSAMTTISSASSSKNLKFSPGSKERTDKNKSDLNNAVLISSLLPKPRRNSSFGLLSIIKGNEKYIGNHEIPKMSRENSQRNIEANQKQFPVRHHQHFTGGFRPNHTTNQSITPKPPLPHNSIKHSLKPDPISNGDRAQSAMPSSFNKLIILENDNKINNSSIKLNSLVSLTQTNPPNGSRPQTQSQFSKKNPSLANIFNPDVNINRMEQYSNDQGIRRADLSSPSIANSTVTYQTTKRKNPKQTKPTREKVR